MDIEIEKTGTYTGEEQGSRGPRRRKEARSMAWKA